MEGLEYTLDEEEKRLNIYDKWPTKAKVIIGILIGIIVLLVAIFIIYIVIKEKDDDDENKDKNNKYPNFIYKYILNISYTNDKIINSFKKGGPHYNETMGNINNGNDYGKSNRNIYDLFIPYTAVAKKNEYNYLILYVHSGGWYLGSKEEMQSLCIMSANQGYISATVGYTLLLEENKKYNANIFRILDEITTCIQSIKNFLKLEGFNTEKLEMVIGGASAGGHLSLLYGYSMKDSSPIPIKFILDYCGPVTLDPDHWLKLKKDDQPLDNIDIEDIENAKKNDLMENLYPDDLELIKYMNRFYGLQYTDDELKQMMVNNRLDKNNEKYKKMFPTLENAYPTHFIKSNSLPVICVYGGKDKMVGIDQFAYLKSINEEYTKYIYFIYDKNAPHSLLYYNNTINIELLTKVNIQIANYSKLYFTSFE